MSATNWQPSGYVEHIRVEERHYRFRSALTGARIDGAQLVPYVWNVGEKARQMRLEAFRCWLGWKVIQRIHDDPGTIPPTLEDFR